VKGKVIVLILGYKSINDLDECVFSLLKQTYSNFEIWFGDNDSSDGSVEYLNKNFSKVKTFQFKKNNGYAGGNNKLIKKAFESKADFCLVLNADTKSDPNLIRSLVNCYEDKSKNNGKVGLIQPIVMLYDKPNRVNSMGNVIHYLGFGYCGGYMSTKLPKRDKEIVSVSGTAVLIPKEYYKNVGLFDKNFFMYNEDQDYSWRGLMMGYKHFLSIKGKVWHKYSFSKNKLKWYHSEKNRLMMIFENYETKTILLMLPNIVLNELMLMVYSFYKGWFVDKIRSYFYFFSHLRDIFRKRSIVQKKRKIGDNEVLKMFDHRLGFVEMDNFIIKYFVNSLYYVFYRFFVLAL